MPSAAGLAPGTVTPLLPGTRVLQVSRVGLSEIHATIRNTADSVLHWTYNLTEPPGSAQHSLEEILAELDAEGCPPSVIVVNQAVIDYCPHDLDLPALAEAYNIAAAVLS